MDQPVKVTKLPEISTSTPVMVFKTGSCQAAVFRNPGGRYVTVFKRRYKDEKGHWKHTNTLTRTNLPQAIKILKQAKEYVDAETDRENNLETDETNEA